MTDKNKDLISAVRGQDRDSVQSLLASGADVNQTDEYGWTALCWVAARGGVEAARELLNGGADPFRSGQDERTPYLIALAAGNRETAWILQKAEEQRGGDLQQRSSRQGELRPYCRAYPLQDLRQFPAWDGGLTKEPASAGLEPLTENSMLFLHRDFTVTRSVWADEQVVFSVVTDEWRTFCAKTLGFHPPSGFDCIPAEPANAQARS
jgi:ankyrin repeat protein